MKRKELFRAPSVVRASGKVLESRISEEPREGGDRQRPQARRAFPAADEEGVSPRPDTTVVPHLLDTSTHPPSAPPCRSSSFSHIRAKLPRLAQPHTRVRKYATKRDS
ncbi:hypothetical protein E2C01_007672 [Portunus trituberculatus]|uniref:Uncharacterized protein n=1 Tax=Portunus trituberculatus TaxID=210409 RepID=A0A5B7D0R2_PORTR|nr:hypothetical protein [Portunus trituberculatus]